MSKLKDELEQLNREADARSYEHSIDVSKKAELARLAAIKQAKVDSEKLIQESLGWLKYYAKEGHRYVKIYKWTNDPFWQTIDDIPTTHAYYYVVKYFQGPELGLKIALENDMIMKGVDDWDWECSLIVSW